INVGTPVANRKLEETESLIGFFVNTLVLRTEFSSDLTFKDVLTDVRETTLQAYANQDVPFEHLVEALQPDRDLSHTPLFQVMFTLQNAPIPEMHLPEMKVEPYEIESDTSRLDLNLAMQEEDGNLEAELEFNTDLFDDTTINRMVTHFQVLLEAIVTNVEEPVESLQLLTEQERNQLLFEWNDTNMNIPAEKCIHELFEEQVEKTPDSV
ncbi:condensation domain-containing protein, partial [Halomonas sp. THAF12]|uniref:condensation domain-containing protein n=1 Tax=Halomonas sp. B23F22_10 TaxID=3459515 RepID=UPI00373FC0E8